MWTILSLTKVGTRLSKPYSNLQGHTQDNPIILSFCTLSEASLIYLHFVSIKILERNSQ